MLLIDLDIEATQPEFAALIGISQPAVSALVKRGILSAGQTIGEWLQAYISNLREQAAGRSLELSEERAGLAREQKLLARIKKQRELGEWAPIENLTLLLSKVTSQMASTFESIPIQIKRQFPEMTAEQLNLVREELAKARNLLVSVGSEAVKEAAMSIADYVEEYDDGATTAE
jgi:phage terminase Nu1 subunit (DNA packaging protein)